ncbi:restriction endonuclease [bacterium]|nr:restriction endonuclease [bacterium]
MFSKIKNFLNMIENEIEDKYITTHDIAKKYNITTRKLNTILTKLKWIEKKENWYITTTAGKENGAEQKYNAKTKQKYIIWNKRILKNKILENNIKTIIDQNEINEKTNIVQKQQNMYDTIHNPNSKKRITVKEKKEKGNLYETYIANHYKEKGYVVWEHGKEKGLEDKSIDLFVKKERDIYFIQCKNWDKWKIDHKEVKATRTDIREYLKNKPDFFNLIKDYNLKILYIAPKNCLTKGAYTYIQENKDIVDFEVIEMI